MKIGDKVSNFMLRDVKSDNYYSLNDLKSGRATVIMFICNHCPYVIHINQEVVRLANEYRDQGVSFIAISSNDIEAYPEDAPEMMSIVAKVLKYPFPYLYDKRQEVAKSFDAECTPEFYVLDGDMGLTYRGRFDSSSPGNDNPITGDDLRQAIDNTLAGEPTEDQYPSMGCGIKWKKA